MKQGRDNIVNVRNAMRKYLNGFKSKERAKLYELQNKCKWYTDFW